MKWLVNGSAQAGILPDDRGFSYGDGLFETIAVRAGVCRLFAEHAERLSTSAERLRMPAPDVLQIAAQAEELFGDTKPDGTLKVIYTRGRGKRGYAPSANPEVTLAVGFSVGRREPVSAAGVAVRTCQTPLGRNPVLAGMKTLNRLEQVLARAEWQNDDVAEGLMFDTEGHLVCGTMTNVFVVIAGQLLTPLLDHCGVRGVMRAQVCAAAQRLGVSTAEARLVRSSLKEADEVFVTNSQIGIWPACSVDGRVCGAPLLATQLRNELARAGIEE